MTHEIPQYTLNDENTLPVIGLGTFALDGSPGIDSMVSALEMGYRLLDTAVNYGNEEEVGEAIRRSSVPREEVQVTSKVPGRDHAYDDAIRSVEDSLRRLGTEYLDLELIHWPNPRVGKYREAWQALVDLRERGLVRSVGVSNFTKEHLEDIIDATGVVPSVNQIELHPYFPQAEMRALHDSLGIHTESWSPLGKRRAPFSQPPVASAAKAHNVTPAQVILRWHFQLGALPIPKSASKERQRVNLDVFDFELTSEEMDAVTSLGEPRGRLFGGDPVIHEEM